MPPRLAWGAPVVAMLPYGQCLATLIRGFECCGVGPFLCFAIGLQRLLELVIEGCLLAAHDVGLNKRQRETVWFRALPNSLRLERQLNGSILE